MLVARVFFVTDRISQWNVKCTSFEMFSRTNVGQGLWYYWLGSTIEVKSSLSLHTFIMAQGGSAQLQKFLDENQYTKNGILRYERIFGTGFVSTGGIETTEVSLKQIFFFGSVEPIASKKIVCGQCCVLHRVEISHSTQACLRIGMRASSGRGLHARKSFPWILTIITSRIDSKFIRTRRPHDIKLFY